MTPPDSALGSPAWPDTPPAAPPVAPTSAPAGASPGGPALGTRDPSVPPAGAVPPPFGSVSPPFGNGPAPTAPTAPAPRPPRRTGLVIGAVVAAFGLLAAVFVVGTRVGRDDLAASSATTPSTTKPAPPTTKASPPTTGRTSPTPPAGGSGSTGTVDEQQVKAEVASIQRFVEKERGLTYKHDVQVDVLADAAFRDRVLQEFESETPAIEKQGALLKSLGMVPADLDVVKSQKDLLGSGVLGFYDPKSKALVVRGDHIGPFFREIVAHELTHALDDQYFPLDRPELTDKKDGSDWAFLALVEGNARRVQYAYVAQMSDQDKATRQEEELQLGMDQLQVQLSTPMILARILMAPYDYGNPFVKELLAKHGQPALDKAFTAPPASSEQILDEAKYDAGEAPLPVTTPEADGRVIDDGTLGELLTGLMLHADDTGLGGLGDLGNGDLEDMLNKILNGEIDLGSILGEGGSAGTLPGEGGATPDDTGGLGGLGDLSKILGGLGNAEGPGGQFGPVETVKGWGGDHYVVYESATKGVCARVDWKMDTPAALADMQRALETWAQTSGATIAKPTTDTVRMTRCAGSAATGGPTSTVAPTTPATTH